MSQSDKRARILNGAVTVFAQNGYYNSKVSDIAKEAGVADGTIYLYFKNKEDLLIQVFLETMDTILTSQEDALRDESDPIECLKIFTRNHFNFVAQSQAIAEVVTVELRQSSKFMRSTDMKPFGRYLGIIARIIGAGQSMGVFAPSLNPRRVARAYFGVLDEFALEWAMDPRQPPIEASADATLDIFLNGLRVRD